MPDVSDSTIIKVAQGGDSEKLRVRTLVNKRAVGALVGTTLALLTFLLPGMQHIERLPRSVMAILGMTLVFWMFEVFENHVVSLLLPAMLLLVGVPAETALSGLGAPAFWLLLAALFFGFAMRKTGLAMRVALVVLRAFKPSYGRILLAFFIIGVVLSFGIPSHTVRIAIMIPIAWSIVKSAGIPERSAGSALIVISTFEMAVLPGFGTLTGSIFGPLYAALFQRVGLTLTWEQYIAAFGIPALLCSFLILGGNLFLFRPKESFGDSGAFIEDGLRKLGTITSAEKRALIIIAVSVGFWATQTFHKIEPSTVALFGLIALIVCGVIAPQEFESGVSWRFIMFLGAIFTIVKVFSTYGIDNHISAAIFPLIRPYFVNTVAVVVLTMLAVYALRMLEPGAFIADMIVFLALYKPLSEMGIPPVILAVVTILAVMPFWFLYQNYWIAMTDNITEGKAFTRGQQAGMATVYAVSVLVSLIISIGYWYSIGLISGLTLNTPK
jgi:anion transporter